jgi:hypothetical protein
MRSSIVLNLRIQLVFPGFVRLLCTTKSLSSFALTMASEVYECYVLDENTFFILMAFEHFLTLENFKLILELRTVQCL